MLQILPGQFTQRVHGVTSEQPRGGVGQGAFPNGFGDREVIDQRLGRAVRTAGCSARDASAFVSQSSHAPSRPHACSATAVALGGSAWQRSSKRSTSALQSAVLAKPAGARVHT